MKRTLTFLVLFQATRCLAADLTEHEAKVEELLEIMGAKDVAEQMYSELQEHIAPKREFILENTESEEEKKKIEKRFDDLLAKMSGVMEWKHTRVYYIDLYVDTFTRDEIDAMIEFYRTDLGRSIAKKEKVVYEQVIKFTQEKLQAELQELHAYMGDMLRKVLN